MRVVMLFHQVGEQAGLVEDFVRNFQNQNPDKNLEQIPLETRQGADMAELYGLTQYPAILILSDDGHLVRLWQGTNLPQISELSTYSA